MRGEFIFDQQLGYVSRPNYRSTGINHDAHGLRVTPGGQDLLPDAAILTTGDSFTYGDEIVDGETWPAFLQADLKRRVLNAGVVGYGLDQIVLRAEQEVMFRKPGMLVMAFIADDLLRSEYRRLWSMEKPYFDLGDGKELELHNVPVPHNAEIPWRLRVLREVFGWSALLETIMRRTGEAYEWQMAGVRALPRGAGETLACPLMQRLSRLGIPTLVVGLYAPVVWRIDPRPQWIVDDINKTRAVLDCAAKANMSTLDLYETIDRAVQERGKDEIFFKFHVSAEANKRIAAAIAAAIRSGLSSAPPNRRVE